MNQYASSADAANKQVKSVTEVVNLADFTDGGAAVGTKQLSVVIPQDAVFLAAAVKVPVAFLGDTSAVLIIGDGSDTDRYNTGTPSVFAVAANGVAMGIPSGAMVHTAAVKPTLTVTTAADWGSVTSGRLIVTLYYI